MHQTIGLLSNPKSEFHVEVPEDFYQRLENISSTIISFQYSPNKLLTFKVYEASQGAILRRGLKNIALRCQIRGTTYTFTREHLEQLSKRECHELFNHLRVTPN
jgi:hypothetical protein